MTEWIISSSVLILVLVLLRRVLRGRISLRLQYGLWALVLLRLLLPVSLAESAVSVMNAAGAVPVVQTAELLEDYSDIGYQPSGGESTESTGSTGSVTAYYPGDYSMDFPTVIAREATVQEYERMERVITVRGLARPLWLCGVGLMLCVFIVTNIRFGVKAKKGRRALETQNSPVPVYISENVHTPCLCGFLRPKIYVTPAAAEDEKTLRHVLAHESTHFRHGDHIWAILRCGALALHWYNPLVWLAAVLSRRDGELACDEGAIRFLGEDERIDYGRTLIRLTCRDRGGVLVTATTMTGSKRTLAERVKLIAKRPHMAAYTLAAVILVAALAVGCTFTGAKSAGAESAVPGPGEAAAMEDGLLLEAIRGLGREELAAAWGEPMESGPFSDDFLVPDSTRLVHVQYDSAYLVYSISVSDYTDGGPWTEAVPPRMELTDGVSKRLINWAGGTWNGPEDTLSLSVSTDSYTNLVPVLTTAGRLSVSFEAPPDQVSVTGWDALREYDRIPEGGEELGYDGGFALKEGNWIYEVHAVWNGGGDFSGDIRYYVSVNSTCAPWPDYAAKATAQGDLSAVPAGVLEYAESYAAAQLRGVRAGSPHYNADGYRVQSAELVRTYDLGGESFRVYRVNIELFSQSPENIIPYRLGYVTEEGWFCEPYPDSLFVAVDESGGYVTSTVFWTGQVEDEQMLSCIREALTDRITDPLAYLADFEGSLQLCLADGENTGYWPRGTDTETLAAVLGHTGWREATGAPEPSGVWMTFTAPNEGWTLTVWDGGRDYLRFSMDGRSVTWEGGERSPDSVPLAEQLYETYAGLFDDPEWPSYVNEPTTVSIPADTPRSVRDAATEIARRWYESMKRNFPPYELTDYRVLSIQRAQNCTVDGETYVLYSFRYEALSQQPQRCLVAGSSYVTADGWYGGGYADHYLIYDPASGACYGQIDNQEGDFEADWFLEELRQTIAEARNSSASYAGTGLELSYDVSVPVYSAGDYLTFREYSLPGSINGLAPTQLALLDSGQCLLHLSRPAGSADTGQREEMGLYDPRSGSYETLYVQQPNESAGVYYCDGKILVFKSVYDEGKSGQVKILFLDGKRCETVHELVVNPADGILYTYYSGNGMYCDGEQLWFDDVFVQEDGTAGWRLYRYDLRTGQCETAAENAQNPLFYDGGLLAFTPDREGRYTRLTRLDSGAGWQISGALLSVSAGGGSVYGISQPLTEGGQLYGVTELRDLLRDETILSTRATISNVSAGERYVGFANYTEEYVCLYDSVRGCLLVADELPRGLAFVHAGGDGGFLVLYVNGTARYFTFESK
ncbi:MAG: M56 family metallopeptidase [Oscillospiraceae bacterium]